MISTPIRRHDLVGNGTAGPFTYQFLIRADSDLVVYVDGNLKTLNTHYTVTGVGVETGGTVTFTTGNEPAVNAHVQLLGAEPYTQTADFQTAATLPAAALEEVLDKQTRLLTQLNERANRTPVMALPDHYNKPAIGLAAPSANKYLAWDALGQNLISSTPVTTPPGLPVGVNYNNLVTNGSSAVVWDTQIYNFAANYLNVSQYASFATAVSAIGSTPATLLVSTNQTVAGNVSVPATLRVQFVGQGKLTINAGVSVTFVDPMHIQAPATMQIFSGSGTVTFTRGGTVLAGWWGAVGDASTDNAAAVQSAATALAGLGGTILFPPGQFNIGSSITIKSKINLQGAGMETSRLHNTNTAAADLLTYSDTTTSNKELRFTYVQDLRITGNTASGKGLVIQNPYQFVVSRCLIENHGGIGIDVQKGANGSTYGQNFWMEFCFVRANRKGGIRIAPVTATSGVDNIEIRACSINQNAYYGLYLDHLVLGRVFGCEFADYYYESLLTTHQAVPVAIHGGNNAVFDNCSFEGNQGQVGTPNYNIRNCWNGDTQTAGTDAMQTLTVCNCDFKPPSAIGDLAHIMLKENIQAYFYGNLFEGGGGGAVYAYKFDTLLNYAGVHFAPNMYHSSLTGISTGTYNGSYLWQDILPGGVTGTSAYAYGAHAYLATDFQWWNRKGSDTYDNFRLYGDGSIVRGLGSTAPDVKFLIGAGSPEAVVTANKGSLYQRTDGGAGTSLYVKESGTGNTGWVAK